MFNFFKSKIKKFSHKVLKLKSNLGSAIKSLFSRKIDVATLSELEKIFYEADLGVSASIELVQKVEAYLKKDSTLSSDEIIQMIKQDLMKLLEESSNVEKEEEISPFVILVVGVNGSGKTTSIAKLAYLYKNMGKSVLIAAADTFRAAAVEQLSLWAEKAGVDIVKTKQGGDPAAVVFDALSAAKARKSDIVLIDTAGRLQNKSELMQELEKIRRVCTRQIEGSPHKTYLTLDAATGQNAIDQARIFNQFTPIDGIILSKMDGSAKGGIIVAIKKELNIPVIWAGVGEKIEDIIPFDAKDFVEELLS